MASTRETARLSRRSADDEFLERASALVAQGWCQQVLAQDRDGRRVEPWSESACRWSPLGALLKAWYEDRDARVDTFVTALAAVTLATGGQLEEWNDARWRTKQHVLNAFVRAREYLPVARHRVRGER